jgi:hypothetical protein
MHENPSLSLADEDRKIDTGILGLLLGPDRQRPWALTEVECEIGDPVATADSVRRLHAAGLAHRLGGFIWASRAAIMAAATRP